MTERFDVAVVGGGIVGLATARRLLEAEPSRSVVVLEAEREVGMHQSSHNSGVLHAGVYYPPGSAKAELCRAGKVAMERFCADHGIEVVHNGKLIIALDEGELPRFEALVARATANGVPGLRVLDGDELREVEPNAAGIRALHSPTTGVVDFGAVCRAMAASLPEVRTSARVLAIDELGTGVRVASTAGHVEASVAVVCAGVRAERLAAATRHRTALRVVPFRGSWRPLTPAGADLVRGNIYPVPDPALPFLGVHFTRRVDGSVWAGPNAVLSLAHPRLLARAARHPGLWRLAWRYRSTAARELWEDRSARAYLRQLQRYLPSLTADHLAGGHRPSGIRAQAVSSTGELVDDFVIEGGRRLVHVLNAPSPAATSSLAIGAAVAAEVATRLG
ncbi:MAG: L-2-hydroxyglutarate oxidase [Acidobacteria bacterium]|nr:L-2-hydroxyglutarate oxidase [Acidobacteriota bacterium]